MEVHASCDDLSTIGCRGRQEERQKGEEWRREARLGGRWAAAGGRTAAGMGSRRQRWAHEPACGLRRRLVFIFDECVEDFGGCWSRWGVFGECIEESACFGVVGSRAQKLSNASSDSSIFENASKTPYFTMFYGAGFLTGCGGCGCRGQMKMSRAFCLFWPNLTPPYEK